MKNNKIINFIKKNSIYLLILFSFYLLICIFVPVINKDNGKGQYIIRSTNDANKESVMEGVGSIFKKNENKSLITLIENYYGALMGKSNLLITRYVDDETKISKATKELYAKYVTSIASMDVYVAPGILDDSYVVVVNGYLKVDKVEDKVPYIDKFYVLTNSQGVPYITTKELNESESVYNDLMYETDTIKKLITQTANEYDALLDKNSIFSGIVSRLGDN